MSFKNIFFAILCLLLNLIPCQSRTLLAADSTKEDTAPKHLYDTEGITNDEAKQCLQNCESDTNDEEKTNCGCGCVEKFNLESHRLFCKQQGALDIKEPESPLFEHQQKGETNY